MSWDDSKPLLLCLVTVLIAGCGPSPQEKEAVAQATCNLIRESRSIESTLRLQEMNRAREKIGEPLFLGSDGDIRKAVRYGLCEQLVLNPDNFDDTLSKIRAQRRAEREARAEEDRLGEEAKKRNRAEADLTEATKNYSDSYLIEQGQKVYIEHCSGCHQFRGDGLSPVFPPLVGSPVVLGDSRKHISLVLNGKPGTAMAAYKDTLSSLEIAAVISYERSSWGNNSGVVHPIQVLNLRK